MRTALVLGGAACLESDVAAFRALCLEVAGVVACNDAGAWWSGDLAAWVSLHPDKFGPWREKRRKAGYPDAARIVGHVKSRGLTHVSPYNFAGCAGSGSSGLFAAKYALDDLGFDRAVLCGVPLREGPHFFGGKAWREHAAFRPAWQQLPPAVTRRLRSMSGWTRDLLGGPEEWAEAPERCEGTL